MHIQLDHISKRYTNHWIFRGITTEFKYPGHYGIKGNNGFGKSTLINIIVGKIPPSKGSLTYIKDSKKIKQDDVYQHFSIATTAMELVEEFTLEELIKFHINFRKPISGLGSEEILKILELEKEKKKRISAFSSGMKQRLKLGLALCTHSDCVVLDEPGSNLDVHSKLWLDNLIQKFIGERILIIASNDMEDFKHCDQFIDIGSYK